MWLNFYVANCNNFEGSRIWYLFSHHNASQHKWITVQ